MDILKKNVVWVALAGVAIAVYAYWQLDTLKKNIKEDCFVQFAGKVPVTNPIQK